MPAFRNLRPSSSTDAVDVDAPAALQAGNPPAEAAADWHVFKMQYHGVWAHSADPHRKSPEDMSKQEFG
eukprot:724915-Karenia_brevis.AAC.1